MYEGMYKGIYKGMYKGMYEVQGYLQGYVCRSVDTYKHNTLRSPQHTILEQFLICWCTQSCKET